MTQSNANDHSVLEIRDEGGHVMAVNNPGNQALTANRNEEELLASRIAGNLVPQSPVLDHTCIFKITDWLFKHNEKDFVPNIVSIGPFHHGKKNLQAMEDIKLWYLHCLLERKPIPETSLKNFVKGIKNMEKYCRDCYDQKFDHMCSDKFVEMMVVDGCFIIELFRKDKDGSLRIKDDPVFKVSKMLTTIGSDLLQLENQIPWAVLDCLFNLTTKKNDGKVVSLHDLTRSFFDGMRYFFFSNWKSHTELENKHLLDYVRNDAAGPHMDMIDIVFFLDGAIIPSVTELLQVGAKFECSEDMNVFNITFNNGVMKIPQIYIQENDESIFRNLIAYDRLAPRDPDDRFSSYVWVFNQLIKSTKDVDFLMKEVIIRTNLSKEESTTFFNRLRDDHFIPGFFYANLIVEVQKYYEAQWLRRWAVRIKHDYLYNPSSIWSITNAVVIAFILTFLQTLYSILAYYK